MVTKGTPAHKYRWRPSSGQLKKSYEVRLAAQFGNQRSKERLSAYNRQVKERKMEANQVEWVIDGKPFNRYKMMDYIVTRVANGEALTVICDESGMPSMLLVYSWFDNHPEFMRDMQRAEEVRGHRLGEEALRVATNTNRVDVAADKLKFEALSKAAARANTRFQDKQVVQQQDEFASMTEDQIRARIQRMLSANPALIEVVSTHPSGQEILQLPESSERPVLDCVQIDTPDEADSLPIQ